MNTSVHRNTDTISGTALQSYERLVELAIARQNPEWGVYNVRYKPGRQKESWLSRTTPPHLEIDLDGNDKHSPIVTFLRSLGDVTIKQDNKRGYFDACITNLKFSAIKPTPINKAMEQEAIEALQAIVAQFRILRDELTTPVSLTTKQRKAYTLHLPEASTTHKASFFAQYCQQHSETPDTLPLLDAWLLSAWMGAGSSRNAIGYSLGLNAAGITENLDAYEQLLAYLSPKEATHAARSTLKNHVADGLHCGTTLFYCDFIADVLDASATDREISKQPAAVRDALFEINKQIYQHRPAIDLVLSHAIFDSAHKQSIKR